MAASGHSNRADGERQSDGQDGGARARAGVGGERSAADASWRMCAHAWLDDASHAIPHGPRDARREPVVMEVWVGSPGTPEMTRRRGP